ncbi:HAD-IIIA family hydrolase [uncultured Sanguibacteroides sp.]|uniref:HAD family hydrolase n=1 Tax=uncultured Sanguibacteroides sp. TaxID=1635151 RepID=UPI00342BE963
MISAIIFDLGDTLIHQRIDDQETLDQMDLTLQDHAREILDYLFKHYRLNILSNTETTTSLQLRQALKKMDIDHFFEHVLTSVDIGIKKPAPLMFETMLNHLKCTPESVIMVGNDINGDIMGAQNMGIKTVFYSIVPSDIKRFQESRIQPDYIIKNLIDLIKLSSTWN